MTTQQDTLNESDKALMKALQSERSGQRIQVALGFVWQLKWFIIASVIVAMAIAYLYVKMQTPMYSSAEKVMFVDDKSSNSEMAVLADLTGKSQMNRIDDEILVLKSPALMANAIEKLGVNYRYYQYRLPLFHTTFPLLRSVLNVKEAEFYKDAPIAMKVDFDRFYPESKHAHHIVVEMRAKDSSSYNLLEITIDGNKHGFGDGKVMRYGARCSYPGVDIFIYRVSGSTMIEGDEFRAEYINPVDMGKEVQPSLSISLDAGLTSDATNMMNLTLTDNKPERAADLLNTLVEVYKEQSKDFKNQAAVRSLQFINERLAAVSGELGNAEVAARDYQRTNDYVVEAGGVDPDNIGTYGKDINELRLQRTFLGMLKTEINKMKPGEYRVIPANVGLEDGGVNSLVTEYNTLVTERARLISNSSESNPSVQRYTVMVQEAKDNIRTAIANLDHVFSMRDAELSKLSAVSKSQRLSIPGRTYDLSKMERRQKIIEPLYLKLNEKKEEIMLSMNSITDIVRVIEPAIPNESAISPNTFSIYRVAFLIGFFLPIVIVFGRRMLRTKVETKEDVKNVIDSPILATIPLCKDGELLINSASSRDTTSESFRILRSSLHYFSGNVIQVTSSVPHEGKSYIAANLAISLSHTRKKVALVGFDLRKPMLTKIFPGLKHEQGCSVVGYLIGKIDSPDMAAIPYVTGNGCQLDIYVSGSIPPNPSELITMEKTGELLSYLREHYDYVICDSAPFMPVSDSAILNKHVDYTLYVVRADLTELRMLKEISACIESGKLKNVGIVLNGLDLAASKYRYGYGYGYGHYGYGHYGYGYGYGYGYSDDENGKKHHHHKKS